MDRGKYKILILFVSLFSLLFIILFVFNSQETLEEENKENEIIDKEEDNDYGNEFIEGDDNIFDGTLEESEINQLVSVTDFDYFFTVGDIIKKYLGYNYSNNVEALNAINDNYQIGDVVTINNKFRNNEYVEYVTTKMQVYDNGTIQNYFVEGYLATSILDKIERKEKGIFVVRVDKSYRTFTIIPTSYTDLKNLTSNYQLYNDKSNILKNNYNQYELVSISANRLAYIYMANIVDEMANYPDVAYAKFSDETKNKYFKTYDDFIKFLDENMEDIYNYKIKDINVSRESNEIVLAVKTEKFNYRFNMEYVMDYKVFIE